MRRPLSALLLLCVPALAGCPFNPARPILGDPMMPGPTQPVYYPTPVGSPMPMPMVTSAPAYPPTATLIGDGPSMDDAYHYVQRYVTLHYPGSEVVAIRSAQVTLGGRIAKAGSWAFTYRAPAASPSATIQAVDIPSQFESRQLTFTINGNNDLFAPEVTEKAALQPLDYARILPLGKAIGLCQSFGMSSGTAGLSVALVSDAVAGTYYEIDNSNSWASAYPGSYTSYLPPGSVRAKYRIDAVTGTLLERVLNP